MMYHDKASPTDFLTSALRTSSEKDGAQHNATLAALAQSQASLRHLYEATPAMLHCMDLQGRLLLVSDMWLAKLGYTREEVIGQLSTNFLTPQYRDLVLQIVHPAFAQPGHCENLEVQMITKAGDVLDISLSVVEDRHADGTVLRRLAVSQDVTSRVQKRLAIKEAHERVSLATDGAGIGIWDWDVRSGKTVWDPWTYRLFGIGLEANVDNQCAWSQCLHPEDRERAHQDVQDALAGRNTYNAEFRILWPDGSVRHLRGAARITRDASGQALRMVGANWDITESRNLAIELAEQRDLLRVTLQSIGDAVITTDPQGCVVWLNPVAERMTGWTNLEAKGKPLTQVFHILNEETRQPTENPVEICLRLGKIVGLANHTILVSRHGDEFGIEDSAAPIRNENGDLFGVVLVFHDVTEHRRLSGEMSYRASHDTLTGLVNRSEFETRLRRVLHNAHEDHSKHALLYIDLDQFKVINDACGHAVGDQMLLEVGKMFAQSVRGRDTLARIGGDEFAIILDHCTGEQAERAAQQICDRMEDYRFMHEDRRFRIGASIGLVAIDDRWTTPAAILQAADTSCYAAKEAGRNRVHVWFDSDMAMRARHGEMQWTTRIEHALDENRFVLFAQRIEPLHGQPTEEPGLHAEVLLRMLDSDGTLVQPDVFIPAAERFHLASRVDRWVLKRTIAWMKAMPELSKLENLSVNLSGQSIGDRAFHRWAMEVLSEAGAQICSKLCLEVTETAAITNLGDAVLFIQQVRAKGVRVALDDFGAGASSFSYLKTLPVDYLKIDGQFIRDLVDDPLDDAAVRCFVDVAKVMNIKTIAEFVDQAPILERLKLIGVDFVQGYHVHRPTPLDDMLTEPYSPVL